MHVYIMFLKRSQMSAFPKLVRNHVLLKIEILKSNITFMRSLLGPFCACSYERILVFWKIIVASMEVFMFYMCR